LSLIEKNKRNVSVSMLELITKALEIPLSILVFIAAERKDLKGMGDDLIEIITYIFGAHG
jgi:transcriptional regulator with XRE-family HTH domain